MIDKYLKKNFLHNIKGKCQKKKCKDDLEKGKKDWDKTRNQSESLKGEKYLEKKKKWNSLKKIKMGNA